MAAIIAPKSFMEESFTGEDVLALGRWLAGPERHPLPDLEEETLVAIAITHRVAGRVLKKFAGSAARFPSDRVRNALTEHQARNQETIRSHGVVLQMLVRDFLEATDRLVVLKGCYAFLESPDRVRQSADIDYIVGNGDKLAARLSAAGLAAYRNVSPHELSNVSLNGVDLDLHRYYPVWSYIGRDDPKQAAARDVRVEGVSLRVQHMAYADLVAAARPVFQDPRILRPDSAAAAIVCCAHAFRDYVSRGSVTVRERAPIRLSDVFEFLDYINMRDFSESRFLSLADRVGAAASIAWMCDVLAALGVSDIGLADLKCHDRVAASECIARAHPRALWGSFWATLPRETTTLFERQTSTAEIVRSVGCKPERLNGITLSSAGIGRQAGSGSGLRLWRFDDGGQAKDFDASFTRTDDTLRVSVAIRGSPSTVNQRIHLDISDHILEWNRNASTGKTTQKGTEPINTSKTASLQTSAGRTRFNASIDLAQLNRSHVQQLPFLLGVGEFGESPEMHSGVLLFGLVDMENGR